MSIQNLCPKHDKQSRTGKGITPFGAAEKCKACNKANALAELRALCPPGSTVYTILRSVSRSGMSRVITPLVLTPDGPRYLTHTVGTLLGLTSKRGFQDGLRIDGGGMDMGFHLVNSLSYALHGMGRGREIHALSGNTDRPGYTLNHRWL